MSLPRIFLAASLLAMVIARADDVPPEMRLEALPQRAPEPKDNPGTAEKIRLGRLLFFDPVLSATKTVACATCHAPDFGWGDGRAVPLGIGGAGVGPDRKLTVNSSFAPLTRNVPTLLNVAFNGLVSGRSNDPTNAPMFWDSRETSLEGQALVPLRSREEMRGDVCADGEAVNAAVSRVKEIAEYRELFGKAFPESENANVTVTPQHLAKAIAAFERSLIAGDTAFDRFMRGDAKAINAQQQRGMKLFSEAGCIHCHGGPMFSDFKLHFIGTPDTAPGGRREFRTPTLRNLKNTAPYMHNGSLRSLEDVLNFYDQLGDAASESLDGADAGSFPPLDPLLKKMNLHPEDFPALTAFLESLNDGRYDRTKPKRVPSGLPVAGS